MSAKIIVHPDGRIVGAGLTRQDAISDGRRRGHAVCTFSDRIARPYRILDAEPALWQSLAGAMDVYWHERDGKAYIGQDPTA